MTDVAAIPGFFQPVSSLSHLLAAVVALVGARSLVKRGRGNTVTMALLGVYVFCVVVTLGISGAYHSLAERTLARALMQRLDYYAIWLLIAGTFTAVHGIMFKGPFWRTGMLIFIWAYACTGIFLQIIRFDIFSGVPGLLLYLGLGWTGTLSIVKMGRQVGFQRVWPFWCAGLAYTAGAVLEAVGHPVVIARWVGPHEVFHFAVIIGVTLHWLFIHRYVNGHASLTPLLAKTPA
ncbi:MAG: hemolysin III family protein [Deltaproteobacteria bacterium]|nr:hemolysin III family protein [Deltaproteobacteria bacterium]